jgi:hypothetical protein
LSLFILSVKEKKAQKVILLGLPVIWWGWRIILFPKRIKCRGKYIIIETGWIYNSRKNI